MILPYQLLTFPLLSVFSACVRQNDEGVVESHWKGAAEIILSLCTRFVNEHGEVQAMTPEKVHHESRLDLRRELQPRRFHCAFVFFFF